MKRRTLMQYLLVGAVGIVALVAWQIAVRTLGIPGSVQFPCPGRPLL